VVVALVGVIQQTARTVQAIQEREQATTNCVLVATYGTIDWYLN